MENRSKAAKTALLVKLQVKATSGHPGVVGTARTERKVRRVERSPGPGVVPQSVRGINNSKRRSGEKSDGLRSDEAPVTGVERESPA